MGLEKFNKLVETLENLPAIGKKSAMRLAYHMVMRDRFAALKLAHAIENAVSCIKKCRRCGGISEDELCPICSDDRRDKELLCIVENAKDIFTIEECGGFRGHYFVLESLERPDVERLREIVGSGVREVMFALTPSIASDAVILFIEENLKEFDLLFTKIAQGVPTGVSLENIDLLSLLRALEGKVKV